MNITLYFSRNLAVIRLTAVLTASWAVLGTNAFVFAQTRPILLIDQWKKGNHWADTFDELLFFRRGSARVGNRRDSVETFYWDSFGKVKFPRDDPDPDFYLGYEVLTLDSSSSSGLLSGQLNDVAVVGAWKAGEIHENWHLSMIGGAGTTNDGHWSNEDAIYGNGAIDFSTPTGNASRLHLGIYFDGNQSLFPDFPLPYITYRRELVEDSNTLSDFPTPS